MNATDVTSGKNPEKVYRGMLMTSSEFHQLDQVRADTTGAPGGSPQSGPLQAAIAFHAAFNLPRQALPNVEIGRSLTKLRVALLEEEVGEFIDAVTDSNLVGIADALADIVCVVYGTAVTYGIDLDKVMSEVH